MREVQFRGVRAYLLVFALESSVQNSCTKLGELGGEVNFLHEIRSVVFDTFHMKSEM